MDAFGIPVFDAERYKREYEESQKILIGVSAFSSEDGAILEPPSKRIKTQASQDDIISKAPNNPIKSGAPRLNIRYINLAEKVPFDCWLLTNKQHDSAAGEDVWTVLPVHKYHIRQFDAINDLYFKSGLDHAPLFSTSDIRLRNDMSFEPDAVQLDVSMLSDSPIAWVMVLLTVYNQAMCLDLLSEHATPTDHYKAFRLLDLLGCDFKKLQDAVVMTLEADLTTYWEADYTRQCLFKGLLQNANVKDVLMMGLLKSLVDKSGSVRAPVLDLSSNRLIILERIQRCKDVYGTTNPEHWKCGTHAFSEIQSILVMAMIMSQSSFDLPWELDDFKWYASFMGPDVDNLIKFYLTSFEWFSRYFNCPPSIKHLGASLCADAKLIWDSRAETNDRCFPAPRPILKFGLRSLGIEFEEDMVDQGTLSLIFKRSTKNIGSWPRIWSDFLSIKPRSYENHWSYTTVMESYRFHFTPALRVSVSPKLSSS